MQAPLVFKGTPGSPYTRKMMALMRYRHIPYRYLVGRDADRAGMPKPPVELLPTFYLPDAQGQLQAVTDSTPLLRRLDREVPGRAARPHSAVLAFIDSLLEDFADEWLTKAMFHYRWKFAPDIDRASKTIPLHWGGLQMDEKIYERGMDGSGITWCWRKNNVKRKIYNNLYKSMHTDGELKLKKQP